MAQVLWKAFQDIVILTTNVRQQLDPSFGELLTRCRFGEMTNDDVGTLQNRSIESQQARVHHNELISRLKVSDDYVPVGTASNDFFSKFEIEIVCSDTCVLIQAMLQDMFTIEET